MNSRPARLACLVLALAPAAACNDFAYPSYASGGASGGGIGDSGNLPTVLPEPCATGLYKLNGSAWTVSGSARTLLAGCSWPVGQTRPLCAEEWTAEEVPLENDLYRVHHGNAGSSFLVRLCSERLYLSGGTTLHPQLGVCNTTSNGYGAHFVDPGTPPLAWLDVEEGTPGTGEAATASGVVRVWVSPGCEWEVDLTLTRVGAAPLERAGPQAGSVVLGADPARVAELARAGLGLLLTTDGGLTWLPMTLLVAEPGLELELAPGRWTLSVAPRPGGGAGPAAPLGVLEVRSGERTQLDW